jgi:Flp pilus assembly protein TadD
MNQEQQTEFAESLDGARQMLRLGRFEEAEALLRVAVEVCPGSPDAVQLLGLVLSQQGRHTEAVDQMESALAMVDDQPALWVNYGTALLESDQADRAISAFQRALELRPDHAPTMNNLSAAFRKAGRTDEAIVTASDAIKLAPGVAAAWNQLGLALLAGGRSDDAAMALNRSLELRDDKPGVWNNLARALLACGRTDDAVTAAGVGASKSGGSSSAMATCAGILIHAARPREALKILDGVLTSQPQNVAARVNHGSARLELGDFSGALDDFRKAIELGDPTGEARNNAAIALLLQGEFDKGWDLHEYRWARPGASPRRSFGEHFPAWDGSDLDGRRLLVWGEQGIGDEIMFAGLLDPLRHQGSLVVECDGRLVPLLERSIPDVMAVARTDPPAPAIAGSDIDVQIAMGSLPRHLRPDRQAPLAPYLRADAPTAASLRDSYGTDAMLVGISWRSGNGQEGAKRSLPLARWGPILRTPGLRFVSLQYGEHAEEIAVVRETLEADVLCDDSVDPLEDMDRFAAQVAAMDLVISVDNSTVHMAGALGRPTWVLLPFVPDWRWQAEGTRTFWYESVRLIRQNQVGNFASVVEAVACELREKKIMDRQSSHG